MEEIVVEKDIDIKTNEDLEIVQGTIKYVTFTRSEKDKALIKAIENGQLDVVKELIKAGANINYANIFGSPLTKAAERGHLEIVQELIKAGADVNIEKDSETALLIAKEKNYQDIVQELIKAGAK